MSMLLELTRFSFFGSAEFGDLEVGGDLGAVLPLRLEVWRESKERSYKTGLRVLKYVL